MLTNRDSTLLVVLRRRLVDAGDQIRDALLSQLQKDRLRQEIIMAELARIERAMALRSAGGERADPVRLPSNGHGVGADEVHDLKKNDGVAHGGVGLEPEKPAMEDHPGECFKTCCGTSKAADQENAALDECKMQESSQVSSLTLSEPSVLPLRFLFIVLILQIAV